MKQKTNTKSSTEAELVGADDAMNFVVWAKTFFEWQMKDHDNKEKDKLIGQKVTLAQKIQQSIKHEANPSSTDTIFLCDIFTQQRIDHSSNIQTNHRYDK